MKVAYKGIFTGLPIYLGLVGDEPLGLLQQQLPTLSYLDKNDGTLSELLALA